MSSRFDRRLWLLVLAGLVITGLSLWKVYRPQRTRVFVAAQGEVSKPPSFELSDQEFRVVKFNRYESRQGVVVVFFDGSRPPQESEVLVWLRDNFDAVRKAGYEVLGISAANAAVIRNSQEQTGKQWPFSILTDMEPRSPAPLPVHHQWGRIDESTQQPLPGTFIIDQAGYSPFENGHPRPVDKPLDALQKLVE